MANSLVQTLSLSCPSCSTKASVDAWLILDETEHPDLLEAACSGSLFTKVCAKCGQENQIDAPLLVYRPENAIPLIFSPADQTSTEDDEQHVLFLLQNLHQNLGETWEDAWLESVQNIPRQVLGVFLREGAEEAAKAWAVFLQNERDERYYAMDEVEPAAGAEPADPAVIVDIADISKVKILEHLQILFGAPGWEAVKDTLLTHPDLLDLKADEILTDMIRMAKAQNDEDTLNELERHRQFLAHCRKEGLEHVFAELPEDGEQLLLENDDYDDSEFDDEEERAHLAQHISAAREKLEKARRSENPLAWATACGELANLLIEDIWGDTAKNFEEALVLYQQALQVFTPAEHPEEWAATQYNLANVWSCREDGDESENIEHALEGYRRAMTVYTRKNAPEKWAIVQNNMAATYLERIKGEPEENFEKALSHCKTALEGCPREVSPEVWAMTNRLLGVIYAGRGQGDLKKNQELAADHLKAALEVYTAEEYPDLYAAIQEDLDDLLG